MRSVDMVDHMTWQEQEMEVLAILLQWSLAILMASGSCLLDSSTEKSANCGQLQKRGEWNEYYIVY